MAVSLDSDFYSLFPTGALCKSAPALNRIMRPRLDPLARTILLAAALTTLHAARCTLLAADPFDRAPLAKMDAEINQAIAEGKLPGAVLWLEHQDQRYHKAYGERALAPESEAMTKDTILDAAS